jgi:purine-cytosine permease-like protein
MGLTKIVANIPAITILCSVIYITGGTIHAEYSRYFRRISSIIPVALIFLQSE